MQTFKNCDWTLFELESNGHLVFDTQLLVVNMLHYCV